MKTCTQCGRRFQPSSRHIRWPACRSRVCSCGRPKQGKSNSCFECRSEVAEKNKNWRGGRTYHKAGYVMVRVPGHPRTRKHPYVFEHILVMEEKLGRYLLSDETVHRNGVRDDNRLVNLELWVRPQPSGIRVEDALAWAKEILQRYGFSSTSNSAQKDRS